ncbi:MAG TPA: polyprenyl synthetase family protein [Polyangiaceae bacterium]|nr:polyprenyl synthetase family protein [Polyangiaceae bacterium]
MAQSTALIPDRPEVLNALDDEFSRRSLASLGSGALADVPFRTLSAALYEPLAEFLRRPGKEFRGELVTFGFRLGGRTDAPPPELALAVEVLHAGSLVVDDIEDDSTERRGDLALHRLFGVPAALNAGNWLYFWPFELLSRAGLPDAVRLDVLDRFGKTLRECHYGQALDLSTELSGLAQAEVLPVVRAVTELKSGSLVAFAIALGAVASGAPERIVRAAERLGRELGTGLQMLDDLSGITSDRRRHKGREDLLNGTPTWPWAWLSTELGEAEWEELVALERGVRAGESPEALLDRLRALVLPIGRERVHGFLAECVARLATDVPNRAVLSVLRRQIERLEKSYA